MTACQKLNHIEMLMEQEQTDYDWEQERRCARCGSTHYLVVDEESKAIFCAPCLKALHDRAPRPPVDYSDEVEDLDFYL